jgi:chemotaxis protein histidine kinase CheA
MDLSKVSYNSLRVLFFVSVVLHSLTSAINKYTGINYQRDDDDLFGDGNDEDESEGGAHVRPSDLQKQVMTQSIRDLEAQRRVTNGLEVFSVSEAAAESAKALAAEEKSRREAQTQASSVSKLQSESERVKKEEKEQKQKETEQQEQREQKKQQEEEEREKLKMEEAKEEEKQRKEREEQKQKQQEQKEQELKRKLEEEREQQEKIRKEAEQQEEKIKEEGQRQKEEIAIQSANAERIRVERLQKDQDEKRRAVEEKEADEQRQLAASISSERERCEAEKLQRADALASQTLPKLDPALDHLAVEKAKKAELQRLKREAFLSDMNAFSHAIEEEAGKAALGRKVSANSAICDLYSSSAGSVKTAPALQFDSISHPLEKTTVPNSFSELTSSLFAANSASGGSKDASLGGRRAAGKGVDIWGESSEVPIPNRAANVTVNPSGRQKRELAVCEYSDRRNGRDDEFEDGTGGATSISNILTKDERMVLSTEQRVAWRALQADLTTRRKGTQKG